MGVGYRIVSCRMFAKFNKSFLCCIYFSQLRRPPRLPQEYLVRVPVNSVTRPTRHTSQLVTHSESTRHHELTLTIITTILLQLQFKELDSLYDY